jgi:chemotaxis protein MotB
MARRRGGGAGGGGGHDAAGMMRWLLTYADLITLMMAFFVIMYAMSKADTAKFNALKSTLAMAFRTDGSAASLIYNQPGVQPVEQVASMDGKKEIEDFQDIIRKVQASVKDQRQVAFIVDERGLTVRFLDNILFDSGSAALRAEGHEMLDAVGTALKNSPRYVRVEGHADNLPINTVRFPSNWELSAARSIAVTRYLIDKHGADPRRLSSLGYGEFRPLYPNTSDENRAKNRRVDIVILRTERSGGEISVPDIIKR